MKRTARELARMIREAYPGASGVALDAADALDEACVEIARLRAAAHGARNALKWAINYDSDDKIMATAIQAIDTAFGQ
jgi:hypothetical protein